MAKWYEKLGKNVLRDVPIVGDVFGLKSSGDQANDALQEGIAGARSEINSIYPQAHELYEPYMGLAGRLSDPRFQNSPEMPGYLQEQYQNGPYQMNEFDFQQDPGYQFERDQGIKTVQQGLAGRGLSESGGELKALQEMGQGLASRNYGQAFNRYMQQNQMGMGVNQQNFQQGLAGRQFGLNQFGMQNDQFNQMANRNQQVGLAGLGVIGDRANLYTNQANVLGNLHTASGQATAASKMAKAQGTRDMIQGGAQLGTAALMASDIRLKENIELVGVKNGHLLYEFNYKSNPDKKYRGVMAHEVQETHPEAVGDIGAGYLGVDYEMLGVEMEVIHA